MKSLQTTFLVHLSLTYRSGFPSRLDPNLKVLLNIKLWWWWWFSFQREGSKEGKVKNSREETHAVEIAVEDLMF